LPRDLWYLYHGNQIDDMQRRRVWQEYPYGIIEEKESSSPSVLVQVEISAYASFGVPVRYFQPHPPLATAAELLDLLQFPSPFSVETKLSSATNSSI
jgi:hypothetical protein